MANRERVIMALVVLFFGFMLSGCAPALTGSLKTAITQGDLETVESILAENPKLVNAKDKYGSTAIHFAAIANNKDMVELLVAKGANVNPKGGRTPLWYACNRHGKKRNDWDIAQFLVTHGAKVNVRPGDSDSALDMAVMWGPKEVVKLFLDKGADVNAKNPSFGFTPLHLACERFDKDVEVLQLLLVRGADVNAQCTGWLETTGTPLCLACHLGHTKAVELLIANGSDVNIRNLSGMTPLRIAARRGHKEIAELLRKHGAVE